MIEIKEKSRCCGCFSCVQRCPKQCITLKDDNEGFFYPIVNKEDCINCGLCENVCPELYSYKERFPLKVYAIKHKNDEIRMNSSSGGVFTLLAEQIIDNGGVVFGARFNEYWDVIHDYTETKAGLADFRGSKYVQSKIGKSFQQTEKFLKEGRKVMFTGTPCQIAGLKRFLRKDYSNLLAVDFVCHGIPSPKAWNTYLNETITKKGIRKEKSTSYSSIRKKYIKSILFRSKLTGWKKYSFILKFVDYSTKSKSNIIQCSSIFHENTFMKSFLSDYILRPSCYECSYKSGKSGADITMGDFWGIEKFSSSFDDDKGCGLMMNYSCYSFDINATEIKEMTFKQALAGNPSICNSAYVPLNRNFYFYCLNKYSSIERSWHETTSMKLYFRIYRKLFKIFKK